MSQAPIESCPKCEADMRPHWIGDEPPTFCVRCRFPLMQIAGKYQLLRLLSKGGFGEIYEAQHTGLTREPQRAIKVIKPEIMELDGMQARFSREVQVTSVLSQHNEHIVRIYDDFGNFPNFGYFYVMELLNGKSLLALQREHEGLLPLELCEHLFLQLCDAMLAAHVEGIVHRDLKPDNLVIVKKLREPHFLKVIDFGIAKPLSGTQEHTQLTQGAVGTPLYMSPEQCSNQPIDHRSDIYSMGIILYELLAGRTPYDSIAKSDPNDTPFVAILGAHIHHEPTPLSEVLPEGRAMPPGMQAVLDKCLAKKPADRFSSVELLEKAFKRAMAGEVDVLTGLVASLDMASPYDALVLGEAATADAEGLSLPSGEALLETLAPDTRPMSPAEPAREEQPRPQPSPSAQQAPNEQQIDADLREELAPQRAPWGYFAAVLLLVVGGGGGWWMSQLTRERGVRPDPRQPHKKAPRRPSPRKASPVKKPEKRPQMRRPSPAVGRKALPLRPRVRKRQAPRKLRKPRSSGKPRRRKSLPGRTIAGCPRDRRYFWVFVGLPSQVARKLSPRFARGRGRVLRRAGGFCIGAATRAAQIRLGGVTEEYIPCKFRIWGKAPRIKARLLKEGGLEPGSLDYCIR